MTPAMTAVCAKNDHHASDNRAIGGNKNDDDDASLQLEDFITADDDDDDVDDRDRSKKSAGATPAKDEFAILRAAAPKVTEQFQASFRVLCSPNARPVRKQNNKLCMAASDRSVRGLTDMSKLSQSVPGITFYDCDDSASFRCEEDDANWWNSATQMSPENPKQKGKGPGKGTAATASSHQRKSTSAVPSKTASTPTAARSRALSLPVSTPGKKRDSASEASTPTVKTRNQSVVTPASKQKKSLTSATPKKIVEQTDSPKQVKKLSVTSSQLPAKVSKGSTQPSSLALKLEKDKPSQLTESAGPNGRLMQDKMEEATATTASTSPSRSTNESKSPQKRGKKIIKIRASDMNQLRQHMSESPSRAQQEKALGDMLDHATGQQHGSKTPAPEGSGTTSTHAGGKDSDGSNNGQEPSPTSVQMTVGQAEGSTRTRTSVAMRRGSVSARRGRSVSRRGSSYNIPNTPTSTVNGNPTAAIMARRASSPSKHRTMRSHSSSRRSMRSSVPLPVEKKQQIMSELQSFAALPPPPVHQERRVRATSSSRSGGRRSSAPSEAAISQHTRQQLQHHHQQQQGEEDEAASKPQQDESPKSPMRSVQRNRSKSMPRVRCRIRCHNDMPGSQSQESAVVKTPTDSPASTPPASTTSVKRAERRRRTNSMTRSQRSRRTIPVADGGSGTNDTTIETHERDQDKTPSSTVALPDGNNDAHVITTLEAIKNISPFIGMRNLFRRSSLDACAMGASISSPTPSQQQQQQLQGRFARRGSASSTISTPFGRRGSASFTQKSQELPPDPDSPPPMAQIPKLGAETVMVSPLPSPGTAATGYPPIDTISVRKSDRERGVGRSASMMSDVSDDALFIKIRRAGVTDEVLQALMKEGLIISERPSFELSKPATVTTTALAGDM